MATRNILDHSGNVIGQLSLPDDATEQQWTNALAMYAQAPASLQTYIVGVILSASDFGSNLMAQFGSENVLMGLTQDQMDQCLTTLEPVIIALVSGSLKIAISRMNKVPLDGVVLTAARIQKYRNMIEDYLGIPRT